MSNRKEFILQFVGGGLGLMLGGCGGGGDSASPATPAGAGCAAFDFSANHGHVLSLTPADLDATTARTFEVQGTAPHSHQVTLTPAQLAALKAGQAVAITTTVDATHSHAMSGACR